ncbi:hypothetical protein HK405_012511 [Cladochytrium tenue]|nr:hypothetical protein HK405_012511 [Cladochytrium tenue]
MAARVDLHDAAGVGGCNDGCNSIGGVGHDDGCSSSVNEAAVAVVASPHPAPAPNSQAKTVHSNHIQATEDNRGYPATLLQADDGKDCAFDTPPQRIPSECSITATSLIDLPPTLVASITEMVGPQAALALSRSCKSIRSCLDPRDILGRKTWRTLREAKHWPDPRMICMSDYMFLASRYGRGCNFCSKHPRLRNPYYEFHGLRFCNKCFAKRTVGRRDLSREVGSVPFVVVNRRGPSGETIREERFLKADLKLHFFGKEADEPARQRLAARYQCHHKSSNPVRLYKMKRKLRRAAAKELAIRKRRAIVDDFIKSQFPLLDPRQYPRLTSYQSGWDRHTKFSLGEQATLLSALHHEIGSRLRELATQRFKLYLADRCALMGPLAHDELLGGDDGGDALLPELADFVPEPELARLADAFLGERDRQLRRDAWLAKWSSESDLPILDAVSALPAYLSASPEDESAFREQLVALRVSKEHVVLSCFPLDSRPMLPCLPLSEQELDGAAAAAAVAAPGSSPVDQDVPDDLLTAIVAPRSLTVLLQDK